MGIFLFGCFFCSRGCKFANIAREACVVLFWRDCSITGAHGIQRTGNLGFEATCRKFKLSFRYCINNLILKKAKYLLLSLAGTLQEEIQYLFSYSCSFFFDSLLAASGLWQLVE